MPSPARSVPLQLGSVLATLVVMFASLSWCAAQAPHNPRNVTVESLNRPVDLAYAFLVHAGDDPAYASPNFDDSSWPALQSSSSLASAGIRNQDFVWYRVHVHIPPHTRNLALLLAYFTGSPQVYVNGVLTGPSRTLAGGGSATPNFDLTAPIPDALIDSGDFVLAIRGYIHNGRHSLSAQPGFSRISRLLLGEAGVIHNQLLLDAFFNYTSNFADLVLTVFTLVITLALWFALRQEREYLYLAVYLAGSVYSEVLNLLQSRYDLRLGHAAIAAVLLVNMLSVLAGLEFARIVLNLPRRRWIIAYEAVIAGLIIISGIIELVTRDTGAPPLPVLWGMLALYALAAGSLGVGLPIFALYIWRRTHNFDALLLSVPILFHGLVFYLYLGYDVFSIFRYGAVRSLPNPPFGRFGVGWTEVADLLFLLALLLFLILRTVRLARARAALAAEIAAAQSVQRLLLSRSAQPTPGFRIETAYHPASEVGGDFFLVSSDPADNSLLVVVGDVSGKGLPAAMRVAMILGVLRRESSRDPGLIMANLNQALLSDDGSGDPSQIGFTTACCLHIAPAGDFAVVNAGHISPYLLHGSPPAGTANAVEELIAPPALPLGLAPGQAYTPITGRLAPRDRLILLSDGIPEARDAHGVLYGFERLPILVLQPATGIAATARSFGQQDDITVLTIDLA